jgi:hypothetical protein
VYKIFRVTFDSNTNEYDLPEGCSINQTIFATDTQAVFIIFKPDVPSYNRGYNVGEINTLIGDVPSTRDITVAGIGRN